MPRVTTFEILGHLREHAALVLIEPRAPRFACGIHIAVSHRSPPGTARPLTPDSAARSMTEASSLIPYGPYGSSSPVAHCREIVTTGSMREYPGARPCSRCGGDAKVRAMAVSNGGELREWRRSRGWDVPELARRLRRAADEPVAAHEGLVRMIRAWERGDHRPSERYELLYRRLGLPPADENEAEPQPLPASSQEDTEPVRRRTFVELTGISLAGAMLPASAATSPVIDIEPLVLTLTGTSPESPAESADLTGLSLSVARARKDYQACRYAELVSRLPSLLSQLDT